ncbi:MAG: hypothetical protein V3S04_00900 [Candidatus Omnitrophota bacterium]
MEVNNIKKKIIDKLKEDKETSSTKAGDKEHKFQDTVAELKKTQEEIAGELKESRESVQALESLLEEKRERLADAEADNKALAKSEAEAVTRYNNYLQQLKEKSRVIAELRKVADKVDKVQIEREGAVKNIETLKSEIALLKDVSMSKNKFTEEQKARVSQLEEMLKIKEDKINADEKYLEELHKEIDDERSEMRLKLQAIEREKNQEEERIAQLEGELEGKDEKIDETGKMYMEISGVIGEIKSRLQGSEREKSALEGAIAQLEQEVEVKDKKLRETMSATERELSELGTERDNLKEALAAKEKSGKDFEEKLVCLRSEIETRDSKIEADTKYFEELIKEIEESKRKAWAASEEAIKSARPELEEELEQERGRNMALTERVGALEAELEARKTEVKKDIEDFNEIFKLSEKERDDKIARLEKEIKAREGKGRESFVKRDKWFKAQLEGKEEIEGNLKNELENEKKIRMEFETKAARLEEEMESEKAEAQEGLVENGEQLRLEYEGKISRLRSDVKKKDERIVQLKSEKKERDETVDEKTLRAEIRLKAMVEERDKTIEQAESEKREILARLDAKEKQEGGSESKIAQLEREIKERDEKIEQDTKEFETVLLRLEESFKQTEGEKREIFAQHKTADEKTLRAEIRFKAAIEERDKTIEGLKNRYADFDNLVKEKEKYERAIGILKDEIQNSYAENENLQEEIEEAKVMLDEVQALIAVEEEA